MIDSLPTFEEPKVVLLTKGLVGTAAPLLAVLTSFQEEVEWYLRMAGLIAALIVSLLTIRSLLRKKK
jgi:hypothetical protein